MSIYMQTLASIEPSALCRSRGELSNEYFVARFGFDTAANEPCIKFAARRRARGFGRRKPAAAPQPRAAAAAWRRGLARPQGLPGQTPSETCAGWRAVGEIKPRGGC